MKIEPGDFPKDFFLRRIQDIDRGGWVRGPAAEFHQKFLQTTDEHFERLKFGGQWRGVKWKPFSPASMGKKRPSGKIIGPQSLLLQDTGRLKREAGKTFRARGKTEVDFITNVHYGRVHNEGGWTTFRLRGGRKRKAKVPARPFQFFTHDDLEDLRRFTIEWLNQ